jgi:hypothetical protein
VRIRARLLVVAVPVLVLIAPPAAWAFDVWESGSGDLGATLGVTLKWSTVLSRAPDEPLLFPERWSAASLWRMRLDLGATVAPWMSVQLSTVARSRLVSEGAGAAGGSLILPGQSGVPFRYFDAEEELVSVGETYDLTHDVDRASVALELGAARAVVGRQALGWGRGVLFGATDIFVPFTPLESDREWRAGVDAIRVSVPMTSLISVDVAAAGGDSEQESAVVGRVYGYAGSVDGEVIAGRRGEDDLLGASVSLPVWDSELHGELCVFRLPNALPDGERLGSDEVVAKAVVGASYSLDIGEGVYLVGEYHYSGFGVADIEDAAERLLDPSFIERYSRGDFSILGRHACAVQASYGLSGTWSLGLSWIGSPVDWSGVFVPSWIWLVSDSVTLEARGYVPHGATPRELTLKSEYGVVPSSVLARISFYY